MRLTQADWDDNVCVDESKLDYVTRPEDYYNTKLNCKIAKIRDLFLNVCNCSMYGLSHYDGKLQHFTFRDKGKKKTKIEKKMMQLRKEKREREKK